MKQDEKILLLGALFHDIGKFEQRAQKEGDIRERHNLLSASFVNKYFNDEILSQIVLAHHKSELKHSSLKGINKFIAEIVCEADNLASGERKPDINVIRQQPFESIFSKIFGNNDDYFQNISSLEPNKYVFPINSIQPSEELQQSYQNQWESFIKEFVEIDKNDLTAILFTLKKYLWCIPSSSWKTRSDISLFEHLKITAAIAFSLYIFFINNHQIERLLDISDTERETIIENRDEERYLLLLADITGIQNYIYNIGTKGALKSLKGRSFYLQQTLDNISFWLLGELFDLPLTNLIYSSGGKFYILLPNTNEVKEKINEAQRILDRNFLNIYNGQLGIVISYLALKGNDFSYSKEEGHLISDKWDKLNLLSEQKKRQKFASIWNYDLFSPNGPDGELIKCAYTDVVLANKKDLENYSLKEKVDLNIGSFIKYKVNEKVFYQILDENGEPTEDYISSEQFDSQKIGQELKKSHNILRIRNDLDGFNVLNLNSFDFVGNEQADELKSSDEMKFVLSETNINKYNLKSIGFKFYGGNWYLEEFEKVIEKGEGIKRLGVLRIDVDNLGLIFKKGFGEKATFSRIVQLSFMLDYFFSYYINLLKNKKWSLRNGINDDDGIKIKELIQIVYSGGDDVFIVGHWSVLPDVALWIYKNFKVFAANNPYFNLSAGIALFHNKFPLFKVAFEAGEFEGKAKSKERINKDGTKARKNGIAFLDKETPISWNDLETVRDYVYSIYSYVKFGENDKKISKSFISRLYSIYYEYKKGKYKNWGRWRWRAAYSLARYSNQYGGEIKKFIEDFSTELFLSSKTEQELIKLLYLIANWTDLLTREE